MKKFLKILLIIVVIIVVLIGIGAGYVALRSMPKYSIEKVNIAKVEVTPARVETGTKLVSILCRGCHYNESTQKFTGRELTEVPQFGKIFSKNITQDSIAGIGKRSDADLIYFLRTGVHYWDGEYVPPYMPKLVHMSDEDLASIIAFLRSDNNWVKPDNTRQPNSDPSFLTKFLVTIRAFEAFSYPKDPIPGPDTTDIVKYGKYITLYQVECFACHSKDFAKNDYYNPEKSMGFFAGGNEMMAPDGKKRKSLNITMDTETGIGSWTEDQFVKAVKTGVLADGSPSLRLPMQPYSALTDAEVKAIYAYLKTVPVIKNKVVRKLD